MSELIELFNEQGKAIRFKESDNLRCPECHHILLEDNWPPNYGSGSMTGHASGEVSSKFTSVIKTVCLNCNDCRKVQINDEHRENGSYFVSYHYSTSVPLVERDGKLMTPHDIWRENYKEEHGEYPFWAYA